MIPFMKLDGVGHLLHFFCVPHERSGFYRNQTLSDALLLLLWQSTAPWRSGLAFHTTSNTLDLVLISL